MEFKFVDIEDFSEEELIELLDYNKRTNNILKSEIEKLNKATDTIIETPEETVLEEEKEEKDDRDSDFEEEVYYYLDEMKSLKEENQIKEDLRYILPSKSNVKYKKLIMRLLAEVSKDIKEHKEIILEETGEDKEGQKELEDDIVFLLEKQKEIASSLIEDVNEEKDVEPEENKLIFVPTSKGSENIRILEDIQGLKTESYQSFVELLNSIKNGTFKEVKRFTGDVDLKGISEVRDISNGTRIAFTRLSKNYYAILTAFIKKNQNDYGYRSSLKLKVKSYREMIDLLLDQINNEEFIEDNMQTEEELFRILNKEDPIREEEQLDDKTRAKR